MLLLSVRMLPTVLIGFEGLVWLTLLEKMRWDEMCMNKATLLFVHYSGGYHTGLQDLSSEMELVDDYCKESIASNSSNENAVVGIFHFLNRWLWCFGEIIVSEVHQ